MKTPSNITPAPKLFRLILCADVAARTPQLPPHLHPIARTRERRSRPSASRLPAPGTFTLSR